MRSDITFVFGPTQCVTVSVTVDISDASVHEARRWMDTTWEDMGCEPVRPSGKVLVLDKILGVTEAYGFTALSEDAAIANDLAEKIAMLLGKTSITVDMPGLRVGY